MAEHKILRIALATTIFILAFAVHFVSLFAYCEIVEARSQYDLLFCTGEQTFLPALFYLLAGAVIGLLVAIKGYQQRWSWLLLPLIIALVLVALSIFDLGIIPRQPVT